MTPPLLTQLLQRAFQCHQAGRVGEAEAIYRRILQEHPDHPEATHLLGLVAHQCGQHQQAIELMQRSIELSPSVAYFHRNLGEVHRKLGKLDAALACYQKSMEIAPPDAQTWHSIGNIQEKSLRYEEAIAAYRAALALDPRHSAAMLNLGIQLERLGDYTESLRWFDDALRIRPDYPLARMARATALLRLGRYEEGWAEYEWRWRVLPFSNRAPLPQLPVWDGSPLNGQDILVRYEQGLGDTLQFVRYASLVAARGGSVVLEVQPPLKRLLARVPGVARVLTEGDSIPSVHCQAPLMSLPRILSTSVQTIPADIPYITADPAASAKWSERLTGEPRLKAGLVWAGNPVYPNDRNRSIPLDALAPLAAADVAFYSLQKGPPASQAASPPEGLKLIDWTAELEDFADTAALVSRLDLVITVDTAVAHLAGALGKPVWNLITFVPDFRWFLERQDTPWYPTMRLFRQPARGDWTTPIARIAEALQTLTRLAPPSAEAGGAAAG